MYKSILVSCIVLFAACSQNTSTDPATRDTTGARPDSFSAAGKSVAVYTTADTADYRLTATGTLQFSDFGQPFETQPCVFVDPTKTFQTFLGIGGALTDASAETFSKLPEAKQQQFLYA